MRKYLRILMNLSFYSAIAVSIFALAKTYYERSKLPEGVCPVDDNRTLIIVGIGLILFYLGLSVVEWVMKKREQQNKL